MNGVTAIPVMSGIPNLPSASLACEEFYQLLWQEKKKKRIYAVYLLSRAAEEMSMDLVMLSLGTCINMKNI